MRKDVKTAVAVAFILVMLALQILIQTVGGRVNDFLCFFGVFLAFLFVVLSYRPTYRYFLFATALLTTVCADYFLVICEPDQKLLAMIFFSVTQICYFVYVYLETESSKTKIIHIATRVTLLSAMALITACVLGESLDPLSMVSVLYFTNLFLNIVFSFFTARVNLFFSVGLICFILCDTLVGMSMLDGYFSVSEGSFFYMLAHPPFNAVWFFYLPAQTLLALSAGFDNRDFSFLFCSKEGKK